MAYTRYWPLTTTHLPGDKNDISHVLSHLGEQTRERHRYFEAIGTPAVCCPATVHSFHDAEPGAQADPLQKYHQVHLQLSAEDALEMQRAYLEDDTLINGVTVSDIYKVVTQHPNWGAVSKLSKDRVLAWKDKRFFAVTQDGHAAPLLLTAAAATINKYPDQVHDATDLTRHLVTVVPVGAKVQLTNVSAVTQDVGEGHHYADHDLWRDILIHCHDNQHHPSVERTNKNVRTLVWFKSMGSYIQYHCDSCAYCLAQRNTEQPVGTAVRCKRRLKLIEFDHKILNAEAAHATGCAAVLTVVDVVSRVTMFIPVVTKSAEETATALFTRWYSLFGVPAVFRMDGDAGFTGTVMQAFSKLMGVAHADVSAADDPTHHAVVERRNKVIGKMLDVAQSKGDLNSVQDLNMYCAAAAAACNLQHTYNGHTVLEYLTGEIPRTQNDLVKRNTAAAVAGSMDSGFLKQLQAVLDETNGLLATARDDEARYNALLRDATQARGVTTRFTLLPGDEVSYNGEKYKLLDLVGSTPTQETKAVIRSVSHTSAETKTVRYATLRPLASPRPVLMHTTAHATVGDFVFYTTQESQTVNAGVVTDTSDDGKTLIVHEHRQAPKQKKRFTPLYPDTSTNKHEVKLKPKPHHEATMVTVHDDDVLVTGSIFDHMVHDSMFDALRSLGVLDE